MITIASGDWKDTGCLIPISSLFRHIVKFFCPEIKPVCILFGGSLRGYRVCNRDKALRQDVEARSYRLGLFCFGPISMGRGAGKSLPAGKLMR